MNLKRTILLTGMGILGAQPVYAEDISAAMATIQDAAAECQYLAQKREMQSRAQVVVRELTDLYTDALNKAVTDSEEGGTRESQMAHAQSIERTKDAALDVSLEADSDVLAVEKEITARRGSLDQCKAGEQAPSAPVDEQE